MDISVKKLSEILKIDPKVLLDKMIAAGLPQTNVEDLVSNEDKQKLLAFIRSSKDSIKEDKPKAIVPEAQKPTVSPKIEKTTESKNSSKDKSKKEVQKEKKSVNINGSIRVNDLARKLGKRGNEVVKKLVDLGEMASLNDEIDQETAVLVAEEFGFEVKFEEEQQIKEEEISSEENTENNSDS